MSVVYFQNVICGLFTVERNLCPSPASSTSTTISVMVTDKHARIVYATAMAKKPIIPTTMRWGRIVPMALRQIQSKEELKKNAASSEKFATFYSQYVNLYQTLMNSSLFSIWYQKIFYLKIVKTFQFSKKKNRLTCVMKTYKINSVTSSCSQLNWSDFDLLISYWPARSEMSYIPLTILSKKN